MISKMLFTILRRPTFALQLSGSGLGTVGGNTLESFNQEMFSTNHLPQIIYHYVLYIFTVAGNTMETLNQEMFSTNHFPHVTSHHHHCCQVNHHMRYENISPSFHVCQIYLRDLHLLEHLNRKMLRRTKVSSNSNPNTNTNTDNLITITNSNIFSNLQAANVNRSLLGGIKVTAANTEV